MFHSTGVVKIIAIKVPFHPFLLPHIAVQGVIIISGTLLTGVAINNTRDIQKVTTPVVVALVVGVIITLIQVRQPIKLQGACPRCAKKDVPQLGPPKSSFPSFTFAACGTHFWRMWDMATVDHDPDSIIATTFL